MTALATVEAEALTAAEAERLAELEARIQRGWLEIGAALSEIHRLRLYRSSGSWESYVVERWSLSRARAYELIRAYEVAEAIRAAGHEPPASEGALRPLRPVLAQDGPQGVVDAWERVQAAHEGGKPPTGPDVRAVLAESTPVTADRSPLDEAGKLLSRLEGYTRRLAGRPLDESLHRTARRYAERARTVAATLDAMTREPLPPDELCLHHEVATRDVRGVCTACRRVDIAKASQRR